MANNEASDMIEKVLNEALKTFNDMKDGDILTEWVVFGHVVNAEDGTSGYPRFVSNGVIPPHSLRGLLHQALRDQELEEFIEKLTQSDDDD